MDSMSYRQLVRCLVHWPLALLTCLSVWLCGIANAQDIKDPIADYLAMKVPDRVQNTGGLWVVKKVEVDIQGDGSPDIFVGTWYRKSGPNTWLWVGYQKDGDGFRRITPADSDVLIDFDNIYVGEIPDLQRQGLVQGYSLELDNKDRDQSNLLSDLEYYYVDNGTLVQQSAGPLDRDDPSQKETYDFFFGPNRKIRETPKVESFTVFDLIHRGYAMPDWAKPR
ncbi:MAG TPA: hypothetical protein VK673_19120 [Chthoniobacterales bacterium]|nr:hypothetical protein [Chthoniobacterales bacterium]